MIASMGLKCFVFGVIFISYNSHSCELADFISGHIGKDINVTKNSVVFSGRAGEPITSVVQLNNGSWQDLTSVHDGKETEKFEKFEKEMCTISGGECSVIMLGNRHLLQVKYESAKLLFLPVFTGSVLAGYIDYTFPSGSTIPACDQPGSLYIKESIEIFMNTGRKDSVVDYLKSINKVKPDGYGGWVATEQ